MFSMGLHRKCYVTNVPRFNKWQLFSLDMSMASQDNSEINGGPDGTEVPLASVSSEEKY